MKHLKNSIKATILLMNILFNIQFLYADILLVTTTNDSGIGSLRNAANNVVNGDSIMFDSNLMGDTILLTSGQIHLQGNISLIGISPDSITISADSNSSIFKIDVQDTLVLENLNLINGFSVDSGGAVFNKGKLTIKGCYINNCSATNGGAIANVGALTVSNCRITNNNATNFGGGIASISGSTIISNSFILNNSSDVGGGGIAFLDGTGAAISSSNVSNNNSNYGGGIINYLTLTIASCEISFNEALNGSGGGIQNAGNAKLTNCTVKGNKVLNASQYGGGIANLNSFLVISSTIDGNMSQGNGGGIYNEDILNSTNSTVSNNSAENNGGGIDNIGQCFVANSTISANNAGNDGGGIWTSFLLTLEYATITNNIADGDGGGIWNDDTLRILNTLIGPNTATLSAQDIFQTGNINVSLGHNLIVDTTGANLTPGNGDILGNTNNPINPKLGPLQNNSGNTLTHALHCGSPAIDAGNPSNAPSYDQRGLPRIYGFGTDIGAFEAQINNVTILPTVTPESTSGSMDGIISLQVVGGFPPYSYSWSGGESTSELKNLSAGTYSVTVTDLANCSSYKIIEVELSTGISTSTVNSIIKVYPNPANDHLILNLPDMPANDDHTTLAINLIDAQGHTIFIRQYQFENKRIKIDLPDHLTKGIYLLSVQINNEAQIQQKVLLY